MAGGASGRAVNQAAIEIERPAAEVFPWLTEPEKLRQWIGGRVETAPLTEGRPRVGARSREVVVMGKGRTEMESEVTALEPGRLLAVRLASPGFVPTRATSRRPGAGRGSAIASTPGTRGSCSSSSRRW